MRGPTFIDLFCGAGGLTLGLREAGWQPVLAIDSWAEALESYSENIDRRHAWLVDVGEVNLRALSKHLDDVPDWLVGGAPCQGFSTVGRRDRRDSRNSLIREFQRIVRLLKPDGFLLENVIGLRDMRFERAVQVLFEKLGYSVTSMVLTAADYGVPQLRRRMIFVGQRELRFFRGPRRTHREGSYITVWDAIGDLPEVAPGETVTQYNRDPFTPLQRRLREGSKILQGHTASKHPPHLIEAISFIPDGGNRRSIPDRHQPRSGFHNSYARLFSRAPAVAVTSNMGKPSATRCIHPFQDRGLTAREGARLQTFPDRFHFMGGIVSARLQIANAVPPLLATVLGRALLRDDRWRDTPGEEQLAPGVDEAYHELPS